MSDKSAIKALTAELSDTKALVQILRELLVDTHVQVCDMSKKFDEILNGSRHPAVDAAPARAKPAKKASKSKPTKPTKKSVKKPDTDDSGDNSEPTAADDADDSDASDTSVKSTKSKSSTKSSKSSKPKKASSTKPKKASNTKSPHADSLLKKKAATKTKGPSNNIIAYFKQLFVNDETAFDDIVGEDFRNSLFEDNSDAIAKKKDVVKAKANLLYKNLTEDQKNRVYEMRLQAREDASGVNNDDLVPESD